MAGELFRSDDTELWMKIYDKYSLVLDKKAVDKKKSDLAALDRWYQDELPKEIASRSPKYISKEEITKLMRWKLMRGKFRPRLTELVQQNSEKEVKNTSEKAFKNYRNMKEAIKELSKLKAVGPATASAIMAASNPEYYPFMADEAMESIPQFKIAYTLPAYLQFQESLAKKANRLSQGSDIDWTPHKVELALWTNKLAGKFGLNLTAENASNQKAVKKRKEVDDIDDADSNDVNLKKTKLKKLKTK